MKYELTSKRVIPKVFLKKIQEWVDQRPQSISDKKVDEGTFSFDFFFLIGIRFMQSLLEKEAQKGQSIEQIYLERIYS